MRIHRSALAVGVAAIAAALGQGLLPVAAASTAAAATQTASGCHLDQAGNGISHVIYLQFDNVHLRRDNPSVPSDLEQMPHLLSFLTDNGTLLANDHDVLQHTATNVLSGITGLYPDRHGITQSNSFRYFKPDGTSASAGSFGYWTDPMSATVPTPLMVYGGERPVGGSGTSAVTPAPWVPFTRAGCDFGAVGVGNTVLENITSDVTTVFGPGSPEAAEATSNPGQANADLVGLAVHCGADSATCANGSSPDPLPTEPGGYDGYRALFGSLHVAPVISPNGPVPTLSGQPIQDSSHHVGFPGFDGLSPDASLGYVAAMQEHGIPVTYAYISDAHDDHVHGTGGMGPGEATYVSQLRDYDTAFARFFDRMAADGITTKNTMFVVTADEGDHFVGSSASPSGCDGVTTPCTYAKKGEVTVNLPGLLKQQTGNSTPFLQHSDPAPAIYVTGNPDRTAPVTRTLGRDLARLSITNPLDGQTHVLFHQLADSVEERILHLVTADPARTPTLTAWAGEDEFVAGGSTTCPPVGCVTQGGTFVWNHGGILADMTQIFMGVAGPGIKTTGLDSTTWASQTDARPTILAMLGLHDDYAVDGRVLTEVVQEGRLPHAAAAEHNGLQRLGEVYTQLIAGPGQFGVDTLAASTRGITGDDATYAQVEQQLLQLGAQRDALTVQMRDVLHGATLGDTQPPAWQIRSLTQQGQSLLAQAHALATG